MRLHNAQCGIAITTLGSVVEFLEPDQGIARTRLAQCQLRLRQRRIQPGLIVEVFDARHAAAHGFKATQCQHRIAIAQRDACRQRALPQGIGVIFTKHAQHHRKIGFDLLASGTRLIEFEQVQRDISARDKRIGMTIAVAGRGKKNPGGFARLLQCRRVIATGFIVQCRTDQCPPEDRRTWREFSARDAHGFVGRLLAFLPATERTQQVGARAHQRHRVVGIAIRAEIEVLRRVDQFQPARIVAQSPRTLRCGTQSLRDLDMRLLRQLAHDRHRAFIQTQGLGVVRQAQLHIGQRRQQACMHIRLVCQLGIGLALAARDHVDHAELVATMHRGIGRAQQVNDKLGDGIGFLRFQFCLVTLGADAADEGNAQARDQDQRDGRHRSRRPVALHEAGRTIGAATTVGDHRLARMISAQIDQQGFDGCIASRRIAGGGAVCNRQEFRRWVQSIRCRNILVATICQPLRMQQAAQQDAERVDVGGDA